MRIAARLFLVLLLCVRVVRAGTINVAAAISLKEALSEVATAYQTSHGDSLQFTFGASGTLIEQIKGGAPIDLFISAAPQQMDDLQTAGLIDAQTRREVIRNRLVLIVPGDSKLIDLKFEQLTQLDVKKIAIGAPRVVPAGTYAMQCFEHLKLIDALTPKLVYGANVRQVLTYVEQGEVSAGVVYATDAKEAGEKIRVCEIADESWHDPIVYPAAVLKRATDASASKAFLDDLSSKESAAIFAKHGFDPTPSLPRSSTQP